MIPILIITIVVYSILFYSDVNFWLQERAGGKNPGCVELEYCPSKIKQFECCTAEEQESLFYRNLFLIVVSELAIAYGYYFIKNTLHENSKT